MRSDKVIRKRSWPASHVCTYPANSGRSHLSRFINDALSWSYFIFIFINAAQLKVSYSSHLKSSYRPILKTGNLCDGNFLLFLKLKRDFNFPFSFQSCNIVINLEDPPARPAPCNIEINRKDLPLLIPYCIIYGQPLIERSRVFSTRSAWNHIVYHRYR